MAFSDSLVSARKSHGLTQEDLARKLYVTRQAVSRWERGEVVPGIDMIKLISTVLDEPLERLLEMPGRICQSCGMILTPDDYGTDAHGAPDEHFCKWCYEGGEYTYETTMDAMIEDCAPRLAENTGMTQDEAVSLMGAVLPQLKRWSAVHSNEMRYGAEARKLYGNDAVDAANKRILGMSDEEWNEKELLGKKIIELLKLAMEGGDPASAESHALADAHARWIELQWGEGAYSVEAHLGLVRSYLCDKRFQEYYDSRAGAGATSFLVSAVESRLTDK